MAIKDVFESFHEKIISIEVAVTITITSKKEIYAFFQKTQSVTVSGKNFSLIPLMGKKISVHHRFVSLSVAEQFARSLT